MKPTADETLNLRKWMSKAWGDERSGELWFGFYLKNQENADQWDKYCEGGLNELFEIVERLKKRIEELELQTDYTHPNGTPCTVALNELQKIIEGKNGLPK